MLGIRNGYINVCAMTVGCEGDIMIYLEKLLGKRDDKVLEVDMDKLKSLYSLTDIELKTTGSVSKLLMERTTLLILEN